MRRQLLLASVMMLAGTGAAVAAPITVAVNSRSTYLRTNNDPATNAVPVALGPLGFLPGDFLLLEALGDFTFNTSIALEEGNQIAGVFSSTSVLLASSTVNRVAGAIEAGADVSTPNTFFGGFTTNITQDFEITHTVIQIPTGAAFLFLTGLDSHFGDNADRDNDFAVRITEVQPVPEPASLLLIGTGAAGMLARRRRRA